jgi:lipopolysaccharide transport system ATP-binding protein
LPLQLVNVGQRVALIASIVVNERLPHLVVGFLIRDKAGHTVWGSNTWHTKQPMRDLEAGVEVTVTLQFEALLGPGSYAFSYALHADETHVSANYEWVDNALVFDVANLDRPQFIGSAWLPIHFEIES